MTEVSPGRAAYEAYVMLTNEAARNIAGVPALWPPWDGLPPESRETWRAAADAAVMLADLQARAERDKARELASSLERLMTSWTRGMYAAQIDCFRGDPKAAAAILSEGLDGYAGPEWDGTETGTEWWERTKAEEGL